MQKIKLGNDVILKYCHSSINNIKVNDDKVIIFNGAPGSGKDTFADALYEFYTEAHEQKDKCNFISIKGSFKDELIRLTLIYYGLTYTEWDERYESKKEKPWDKLNGLSQREALIDMSENKIKPILGKDFFGKAQVTNFNGFFKRKEEHDSDEPEENRFYDLWIYSDGGFEEEIQPLIKKVGKENILIVRLHRKGCNFKNDSRNFLDIKGVKTLDIDNEDICKTFIHIENSVTNWLRK